MTQVLYAARGGSATISDLYTIDPATGAPTSIGPIGYALTGLAEDPTDGTLYGATSPHSGASPRSLITIDKATGAAIAVIGSFGNTVSDIGFDSSGQLYGFNNFFQRFCKIDKSDASVVPLGSAFGLSFGNGFSINASNVIYWIVFTTGTHLWSVDTTSGAYTDTGTMNDSALSTPSNECQAGAFDSGGTFWGIYFNSGLGKLNVSTRVWTDVGLLGGANNWDALAWGSRSTPPPPPGPSRRFFSGYPWRFIVTDLNSETITFLDRLATSRQVTVTRNAGRQAQGLVPSDSPEINILHTDGDPFLNEGNRLVYGFRREGWNGSVGPWVCRFAGPLLHLEDNAQTDAPASPWIAQDPWAILYRRPVRLSGGGLPGVDGRVFLAADLWSYPEIALQLLLDSITYDGTCFIDPTGGTVVSGPTIAADFTLQQGLSVGQAWDQLCATGKVDIELDPVYDPVGSPGICAVLVAKPTIGVTQNAAIFAWDLPSRSLTDISRVIDGTGRANTIQYYLGQGGPPVSVQIDAASAAKYGEYWEQQFWPGFRQAGPVSAMAARRLALVKDGVRTFTFAPAPERSPIPFDDYMAGDWAPFFASKKLRAVLQPTLASGQWTNIPRLESFTVDIADNQTETVNPLLVSMDIQP